MLPLFSVLAFAVGLAAHVPDTTELRGQALIAALQRGGYTILLRHARTDRSVQEGPGYATLRRAEQRNLSDDGVRDAKLIGQVMKRFGIPIGEILSSQMYRTRETAEYAFGDPTPRAELQELQPSPGQRELVVAPAKAGTNRAIVTHHFVIERYLPVLRPGELAEGEAAIVRPESDGRLTLVGRFTLADWQALAPPPVAPPARAAISPDAIPSTPAGVITRAYLDAFNTGDAAVMRTFIERYLSVDPSRPTEARVETFRKLAADFGTFALLSVDGGADDSLTVTARSKQGEARLTVMTDPRDRTRAASIKIAYAVGGIPNH
jgi:phosphohistidine phosphatase SixA